MGRYLPEAWALPEITRNTRSFFTSGKLLLQICKACGNVEHPPEDVCRECQAMEFGVTESKGVGTIYSFTIVHHSPSPLLTEAVPYNIVLVSLDDHPHVRITGNVVNAPLERVRIGLPVRAVWAEVADEQTGETLRLAQWELL